MARQLDFSPLDRRREILDSEAYRSALENQHPVWESVIKGVGDMVEAQKTLKKELNSLTEYDEDITLDAQTNSWLAVRFNQDVKGAVVNSLLGKDKEVGKKWFLTPSDLSKIEANKKQWARMASNAKALVDAKVNALQESQKGIYEFDMDEYREFEDVITGKKDVPNPNAVFENILQNPDGVNPFLRIKEQNADTFINNAIVNNVKSFTPFVDEALLDVEVIRGGKSIIDKKLVRSLKEGADPMIKSFLYQQLSGAKEFPGMVKWLEKSTNGAYSGQEGFMRYINELDLSNKLLLGEEHSKVVRQDRSSDRDITSDMEAIPMTPMGWDYSMNSIKYEGELPINGKMRAVTNAKNVGVKITDEGLMAKFVVSVDAEQEKAAIEEKIAREISEKKVSKPLGIGESKANDVIKKEVRSKYKSELDALDNIKDGKMIVYVPYEDVAGDLETNLKDKDKYLEGMDEYLRKNPISNKNESPSKPELKEDFDVNFMGKSPVSTDVDEFDIYKR